MYISILSVISSVVFDGCFAVNAQFDEDYTQKYNYIYIYKLLAKHALQKTGIYHISLINSLVLNIAISKS